MPERLPKAVTEFRKRHPEVWKAFNEYLLHEGEEVEMSVDVRSDTAKAMANVLLLWIH